MTSKNTLTAPPLGERIESTLAAHELVASGNNGGWMCECGAHRWVIPLKEPISSDEVRSVRAHQVHVAEEIAALGVYVVRRVAREVVA